MFLGDSELSSNQRNCPYSEVPRKGTYGTLEQGVSYACIYSVCVHVCRCTCLPNPTPMRFFLLSIQLFILNGANGLFISCRKKESNNVQDKIEEELQRKKGQKIKRLFHCTHTHYVNVPYK